MGIESIAEGRRKFGNGFCNGCNGCNGCQEEGRRKKTLQLCERVNRSKKEEKPGFWQVRKC
ncbi:hypothetical protein NDI43_10075 [Microcoleus vaginatus GB2-A3]|uniref:hypothetical protein n=1 Tax=Microcoleus vaginatus TaxID=119532 RepID=UPI0032A4E1F5